MNCIVYKSFDLHENDIVIKMQMEWCCQTTFRFKYSKNYLFNFPGNYDLKQKSFT